MLANLLLQDKGSMLAIYATVNVIVFISGVFVILMQAGFMMLEAGSLARKNAVNNIFKNFVDVCVCGVIFFLIGYPIVTGDSPLIDVFRAIGMTQSPDRFAEGKPDVIGATDEIRLFFNFAFAATAVTICSGSVTGRITPFGYLIFGAIFAALIYPVVAFMVWHPEGLLYGRFADFAGAMVVHGVGGFAGLAGALMLGPRIGEHGFGEQRMPKEDYQRALRTNGAHNLPIAALGVFLLWLGWYGFMAGSAFANGYDLSHIDLSGVAGRTGLAQNVFNDMMSTFGRVLVNATLAPCAGVLTVIVVLLFLRVPYNMPDILNGALAGLVAITASANIADHSLALLIGAAGGAVYIGFVMLMYRAKIDDPVMAFPVHGAAGLAGVALYALASGSGIAVALSQIMIGAAVGLFAFLAATVAFVIARIIMRLVRLVGRAPANEYGQFPRNHLRVPPMQELEGLDDQLHGQNAYNLGDPRIAESARQRRATS